MISSSRSETIEDTYIQAKISKMKTLYFFLIAISVTLIAHACKTSSVQEVQDNREICRPTFITPDDEEIKGIVAKVVINHYQNRNFLEVAKLIVEQLEDKHHQDSYHWSCNVGLKFGFQGNGLKYWIKYVFIVTQRESSTELLVFCSMQ